MEKRTVPKPNKKNIEYMTTEEFMEDRINTYGKKHKIPEGKTCGCCYYHDAQFQMCDLFLQPVAFYGEKLKECIEFVKDKK